MDSRNYPTFARTDLASGRTAVEQEKTIPLIWSIENFNQDEWRVTVNGENIRGPEFKFHPLSEELWRLELCGTFNFGLSEVDLDLSIIKVSECSSTAKQFTVCWSAERNGEHKYLKKNVILPANVREHPLINHTTTYLLKYFFNEASSFTMVFQIEMDDIKPLEYRSLLDKGQLAVLADMESILKDAELTDIALRSEGKEIRAHKVILAGRSAVFKSMFVHQMSEKASGSVDISDVPHDILQQLVTYMYSGRLENLDVKSASELFAASDKYAVEDLHDTCSLFLEINLTAGNCLKILLLADTHSNEDLKRSSVEYFTQHFNNICQIPDWEHAIASRPHILIELLKVVAKKN